MRFLFTKPNIAVLVLAFVIGSIAFSVLLHRNRSHFPNSLVMKSADFGSLNSSDELFGTESSQERSQQAESLNNRDDIQIVVYRNVDLVTVKRTYPELAGKYVYRYVEYSQAIDYLDKQIEELKANSSQDAEYGRVREKLISEYEQSRSKIIERLGP